MNPIASPLSVLGSFHYLSKIPPQELVNPERLRMIADSGAFSAHSQGVDIEPGHLYQWYRDTRDLMFWQASLDVIGDPEASWRNWSQRPDDLPDLVPTIHYPADPRHLNRYVEAGADFIGLGGQVPHAKEPDRLLRWLVSVFRYARDNHPHVRFHGWGVNNPKLTLPLPWWSVDSSTFGSSYRFGRMMLWEPRTARIVTVKLNGHDLAAHSRLLERGYGADWRDVLVSNSDNRGRVIRLSGLSCQAYERYLQDRHRVSPPASLVGKLEPGTVGPLVHFADAAHTTFKDLTQREGVAA